MRNRCLRERTEHTISVAPGETLLLITDGLIEAGHLGIDDGLTRLTAALAQSAGLPVEQLRDRLLHSIPGGQIDDDIALLAVRGPRCCPSFGDLTSLGATDAPLSALVRGP